MDYPRKEFVAAPTAACFDYTLGCFAVAKKQTSTRRPRQHAASWCADVMVIQFDQDAPAKLSNTKISAIELAPTKAIGGRNNWLRHFTKDGNYFGELVNRILLKFDVSQQVNNLVDQMALIGSLFLRLDCM